MKDLDILPTQAVQDVAAKIAAPIQKEAIRLKTTSRTIGGLLLLMSIGLAMFWYAQSSSDKRNASGSHLITLRGSNRFTVDSLGTLRERLSSKTDSTLYEFLADHHDEKAFQATKQNVVREVFVAIEHESVQAGVALVIQLFSDIYSVWPQTTMVAQGKKTINKMIKDLEDLEKRYIEERLEQNSKEQSEDNDSSNSTEIERPSKPQESKVELGLNAIRKQLREMKNLGQLKDVDEKMFQSLIESKSPLGLASLLKSAIYVDECRPYLEQIDKIRMALFKGKRVEHSESLEEKKKKQKKESFFGHSSANKGIHTL
jgi:hypothetical protein